MRKFYFVMLLYLTGNMAFAQPDLSTHKVLHGITVYQDFGTPSVYYYSPREVRVAKNSFGEDDLLLIVNRYVGTQTAGDVGHNYIKSTFQVGLVFEDFSREELVKVKRNLGLGIQLKQMPVSQISAQLIVGIKNSETLKLANKGDVINNIIEGNGGYRRTYAIPLDLQETQLIESQIKNRSLVASFSYELKAKVVQTGLMIKKTMEFDPNNLIYKRRVEKIKTDTIPAYSGFYSNAVSVSFTGQDIEQVIKHVDINEMSPPMYSILDVRCYDFSDNIRPELALKVIEFEATGLNNKTIKSPIYKFSMSKPDQTKLNVTFPYAVAITKPFSYRVTEYLKDGTRKSEDYNECNNWFEILNITTQPEKAYTGVEAFQLEINPIVLQSIRVKRELELLYTLNKAFIKKIFIFSENLTSELSNESFFHDKNTAIDWAIIEKSESDLAVIKQMTTYTPQVTIEL